MRTLASRMVVLALAQMALLAIAALIIWYFTVPHHHHHHGPEHEMAMVPPEMSTPPRDHHGPEHEATVVPHEFGPWLTFGVGAVLLAIGSVITARWIVRPIDRLSRSARALGAGDLGVRTRLDRTDEIGELGRRFDEMAEQIERMIANERELLANVAHELRTPLSRIGVALDLAGEGDSKRARASLGEIAVDVAELEVIVNDILMALRYDTSRGATMPLRKQPTPPETIVTAAAERMRSRHPERKLDVAIASELPVIDVDPVLFRRVIDNLLDNAHKYTPDTEAAIVLAARPVKGGVEFEVADRGIGIATAELPNVYNPFFRAERSRARETGGVGLGLTLAKRIVEAHGGTIDITSAAGKGTQVRVAITTGPSD
ncbi:MAG: HAMP domain-containing histidine kinase [Deltaproteobacteria bacterium]|nr:HAMP domain-containing histidine kinase [Deltaproteobacteria bacterium]